MNTEVENLIFESKIGFCVISSREETKILGIEQLRNLMSIICYYEFNVFTIWAR